MSSSAISFESVLFLIFLTLKMAGLIDWSWWWVTSPIWIPVALVAVVWACIWAYAVVKL